MRSRDVQNELTDDFQPAAGIKVGPDGFMGAPEPLKYPNDPPRLCEAGPCRHFHTMTIRADAQNPQRGGEVFHTEDHFYCYPGVGIESNLGPLPILACNRWSPIVPLLSLRRKGAIKREYDLALEQWRKVHVQVRDEDGFADQFARALEGVYLNVIVTHPSLLAGNGARIKYDTSKTLASIADEWARGDVFTAVLDGVPIDNTQATLLELGAHEGSELVLTFTLGEANK